MIWSRYMIFCLHFFKRIVNFNCRPLFIFGRGVFFVVLWKNGWQCLDQVVLVEVVSWQKWSKWVIWILKKWRENIWTQHTRERAVWIKQRLKMVEFLRTLILLVLKIGIVLWWRLICLLFRSFRNKAFFVKSDVLRIKRQILNFWVFWKIVVVLHNMLYARDRLIV